MEAIQITNPRGQTKYYQGDILDVPVSTIFKEFARRLDKVDEETLEKVKRFNPHCTITIIELPKRRKR
jgi:hypothetical protein